MSLQGILFDLDGTLANTLPVCVKAYQHTAEHFTGQFHSDDEIISLFGPSDDGILERLMPGRLAEILPYYLNEYEQIHIKECKEPFPGVEKVLDCLQAKAIKVAVVTAKGQQSAAISLRVLGLIKWIDTMETCFPARADKPRSIRKVLDRWRIRPECAAYVGDTPYDINASLEVGLLPIGAAWAQSSTLLNEAHPGAYKIFTEIEGFLNWIEFGEKSEYYFAANS
jgi:pyrophosphatase PpaX